MKYAVYDPDTEQFVSNVDGGSKSLCMTWSNKVESAQLYASMESATNLLGGVHHGFKSLHPNGYGAMAPRPNAIIVEVALSWKPVSDETYTTQKAIYEKHLPMYRTAVDDISAKNWKAFKAAREFLRLRGETVE